MALAQALTYYLLPRERVIIDSSGIESPDVSLGPIIAYFFGVVVVIGVGLFLIPLSKLKLVFKVLFAFMFGWGIFVVSYLVLPSPGEYWLRAIAIILAVVAATAWLWRGKVWLHDFLMLVTLSAAASVFGFLFSPLTFLIFLLIVAVYDVVAVRFGFMVWMADKMSEFDSLPAFIFPRRIRDWTVDLREIRVSELRSKKSEQREHSILGGGDIGFPLMLTVSVFFQAGLARAAIVGALALAGLMGAFLVQLLWLKDRPVPALPPIALACLIGFFIVRPSF